MNVCVYLCLSATESSGAALQGATGVEGSVPEETGGATALRLRPILYSLDKQLHPQCCHGQSAHHTLTDTVLITLANCYRHWTFVYSNSDNYGNTISSDVDDNE